MERDSRNCDDRLGFEIILEKALQRIGNVRRGTAVGCDRRRRNLVHVFASGPTCGSGKKWRSTGGIDAIGSLSGGVIGNGRATRSSNSLFDSIPQIVRGASLDHRMTIDRGGRIGCELNGIKRERSGAGVDGDVVRIRSRDDRGGKSVSGYQGTRGHLRMRPALMRLRKPVHGT